MMTSQRRPSPFISFGTGHGGEVQIRAVRYGIVLDYDGNPLIPTYAGTAIAGRKVADFVEAEPMGHA